MSATPNLAEQALQNLVNQFARPLDFLRELAQNSMDAGSPRIEVKMGWDAGKDSQGVLKIHVDDFGEGMDETIIDDQLTRLFSSTKEDDLTKIGKFGIGFTSIFAIRPEAVLLQTGRHGQYWELVFHQDRSFEKRKVTEPIHGTRITLFKRMHESKRNQFIEEARIILNYWCEHSDTPITFWDQTDGSTSDLTETADPFAAFDDTQPEQNTGPEMINQPLQLDSPLWESFTTEHHSVVIGFTDRPRYGFYNGGLTLLNTHNRDALGMFAGSLKHLSFKVKNDHLEHTLTRDNVLHDERWETAMKVVLQAREALRDRLIEEATRAAEAGEDMNNLHDWLADEVRADAALTQTGVFFETVVADVKNSKGPLIDRIQSVPLFPARDGAALSLAKVRAQEVKFGSVLLYGNRDLPVYEALEKMGLHLIADRSATRELLRLTSPTPMFEFFRAERQQRRAEEVFVQPQVLEDHDLSEMERALIEKTRDCLLSAMGIRIRLMGQELLKYVPSESSYANRLTLKVGDFGGLDMGASEVLALNGPKDGRVFLRPQRGLSAYLPSFLQYRILLVNRNHPLFRAHLLTSDEDLLLAAGGLAHALLITENIEGPDAIEKLSTYLESEAVK